MAEMDVPEDNPDWSDFAPVPLDYAAKLKAARAQLSLGQADFATLLHIPSATLRNWEQRRTRPDALGLTMIDLVYDDPAGMAERLRATMVA